MKIHDMLTLSHAAFWIQLLFRQDVQPSFPPATKQVTAIRYFCLSDIGTPFTVKDVILIPSSLSEDELLYQVHISSENSQ